MKKAIFFDIDGTLIDSINGVREITPRVKKYIKALQDEGNYIFIASGRPYAFISKEVQEFGFDGFVLANGAHIIVRDKLIYKQQMDKKFLKNLIVNFEKLDIQYILQGEKYSYLSNKHKELALYYDGFNVSRKYIKSEYDIDDIDIYKMEMLCKSSKAIEYCLSLENREYDCLHNISSNVFEFYSKKNTKASGIMKVLEYLNIPIRNSYAFGDGKNDIEMLETVGCGIAMGNASKEVKNHANEVTYEVQNDGIAVGIKNFIINPSKLKLTSEPLNL